MPDRRVTGVECPAPRNFRSVIGPGVVAGHIEFPDLRRTDTEVFSNCNAVLPATHAIDAYAETEPILTSDTTVDRLTELSIGVVGVSAQSEQ
jgi:hypothetical protein